VPSKLYLHTQLSELKHKCKRGGKPRAYLEQLRGKDEDEGDDRLALAGRCLLPHGFLSVSPLFPDLSLSLLLFRLFLESAACKRRWRCGKVVPPTLLPLLCFSFPSVSPSLSFSFLSLLKLSLVSLLVFVRSFSSHNSSGCWRWSSEAAASGGDENGGDAGGDSCLLLSLVFLQCFLCSGHQRWWWRC
jgi:hypothetical protein